MSIFPYVHYMMKDFGTTNDDSKIAVYAGMVTYAIAFAEFSSGVVWGRLSDRIGRKLVLLTGLAGTALSMLTFGFAPNFLVALIARVLGGVLNGQVKSQGDDELLHFDEVHVGTSGFCGRLSRK